MSIDKTVEKNVDFLKIIKNVSIKFIREHANNVAVPFSGGKDSLACLILAKKALGDVKAIYIRTNYDMPYTDEYVECICEKLGVNLIVENVNLDVEKYGIPTHKNRWYTKLKIEALERVVKSEGIDTERLKVGLEGRDQLFLRVNFSDQILERCHGSTLCDHERF